MCKVCTTINRKYFQRVKHLKINTVVLVSEMVLLMMISLYLHVLIQKTTPSPLSNEKFLTIQISDT